MDREKPVKTVRAVERALTILLTVTSARAPMGLSEISVASGVDKATALRLLNTLEAFRLVQREADSRKYAPGSGVWQMNAGYRGDLKAIAEPHLETLRNTTEESVSLMCQRGLDRVVLMAIEPSHELRVVPSLNSVNPIYSGASGKVFMAFLPDEERDRIIEVTGLKPVNQKGLTDRKSFLETLDKVRRDGCAVSVGDVTLGASAVAAPVFDRGGAIVAVVSLRGPDARMPADRIAQLAPLVVEAADAISQDLSGMALAPRSA